MIDFQAKLPKKPYCTDDFHREGLKILPLSMALGKRYIQMNHPAIKNFLIFDIDRPRAALATGDAGLPSSSICVVNPINLHAHLFYALLAPVCMTAKGRAEPQKYCKAIEWAYEQRLGADHRYSGLIAKNPWSPVWWATENGNLAYDLGTLVSCVV